jgi:hypothetical protein
MIATPRLTGGLPFLTPEYESILITEGDRPPVGPFSHTSSSHSVTAKKN